MIVEQKEEFIDIVKLLPESLPSGKKILWKELENGVIEVSVDKNSARGGNASPIRIKRFIEINEELFQLLGLWFGDGIKRQWGSENAFGFSNTELALHKIFLNLVDKSLGIKSTQFNCILSLITDKDPVKELENKVSKELNIPLKNFWNARINPTRNLIGVDVKINSRLLSLVMHIILDKLEQLAVKNKIFSSKILQGIIASEANVHVRSDSGRLGEILIAAEGEDKRNFIRQLLLTLEIFPSKDKTIEHQESVLIHGLSNFRKVKEWNLIALHPKKFEVFELGIKGFKKKEFRKGEGKFLTLKILAEQGPKRAIEIAKILNRSFFTILNESLLLLEKQGFVDRERSSREVFWKITEKGRKILESGNPLEKLKWR